MRRTLFSLLAATSLLFAAPALAQEAPVPLNDWTGFYLGVLGGAAFGEIDGSSSGVIEECFQGCEEPIVPIEYGDFNFDDENFLGGLQAGFDWQHRNFVFGIVGDIMKTQIKGSEPFDFTVDYGGGGEEDFINGFQEYYGVAEAELEWLATLRAKLGYVSGPLLFFLTGGVAWGEIDARVGFNSEYYEGGPFLQDISKGGFCSYWDYCDEDSDRVFGYTLGGGVAANLSRHMFAELSYLYVNLKDAEFNFNFDDEDVRSFGSADADFDAHLVRFALNWRF